MDTTGGPGLAFTRVSGRSLALRQRRLPQTLRASNSRRGKTVRSRHRRSSQQMGEKVAFIGLGVMGHPMAGHLARAGHKVTVYNRTRSRAEQWLDEYGGALADTPAEAVAGARFVFCCVGNDDDVRQVTLEEGGAFVALEGGAVFIDHTTDSAELARELDAAARKRGASFLDAPVSGGQAGAEQGTLTVMLGGEEAAYQSARFLIDAYARMTKRLGPAGSGQLAKMVNQICIAGILEGLAEG
ncbi:MAG: NAD(P)-dependent oxidoreductase, partial [Myxococcales bacterium]|nr:NAD(P)-dependent oxidoreductase [Myxococcales bacterium]